MKASLYELSVDLRSKAEQLANMDLPAETVRDTLEGLSGDLEVKAANVVAVSKSIRALAAARREAAQAMLARADKEEARADEIDAYVLDCMQLAGIHKIESPWFSIGIAKNPPAVHIEDERQIPKRFYTQLPPPEPKLDRKAIATAIKNGEDVPGVSLRQGSRLNIKG